MRLAVISTILRYPWGGADTLWTHGAEAARAQGDQLFLSVSTAVTAHPRIAALIQGGAAVFIRDAVPFPPSLRTRLLRKLGWDSASDTGLIAALKKFRPNLVIISQGGTYDLVLHQKLSAWLQQTGIGYRIIANWQEERPQLAASDLAFIRQVFAAANRLFFVSTRNLAVTRRHLGLSLPNAEVIQNPLRWRPGDVSPWPVSPAAQLATVSRLEEGKGIHLLLQALHAGRDRLPAWLLNVYGHGPQAERLQAVTAELGLLNRVRFHGHVNELRVIWAENQLLVSPAIDDGVPMTIPEAMLCQRPVLATCVGGAEDWLRDGVTGFLCPTPEVTALADTLQRALAAREHWVGLGQAAAAAAAARYQPADYLKLIAP